MLPSSLFRRVNPNFRACRDAAREIHTLECRADIFERRQTDTADAFRKVKGQSTIIMNLEPRIISRESTHDSWLSESTRHFGIRVFLALRTALHMRREDLLAARMEDGGGGDERFRRQFAMVNHGALKGRSQLQL